MEAFKQMLTQTDDEYLIGLSNKGTVKRAYKDLDQEPPTVTWGETEAEVTLKEAVCTIRMPLGESTCTCPSRSVCRHLITAILYLKSSQADTEVLENTKAEEEILSFPLQKLRRACGNKRYQELLYHLKAGEQPQFQEGTVITVKVPWEAFTVKLLSPLEYSSCSCKSKELCPHKAQAILLYQLHKHAVTLEHLEKLCESKEEWDHKELDRASASIQEEIRLQLMTGLSRLSPEAAEGMERLAVISRGAGLAAFETSLRKTASEYRLYFDRAASFQTEELLEQLLSIYQRAGELKETREPERLRTLAGSFREAYRLMPRLHLIAMGSRSFHSKTGYEGEIYYFMEPDKGMFYQWTDARPVFYEGVRRRPPGRAEQAQAPWGLNCSREQMMDLEFYLDHAKAARDGRLSVSQETKSEVSGARDFRREDIRKAVFWDYEQLLSACFGEQEQKDEGERLALAGALSCREAGFDTVHQRFSMELLDKKGRKLSVAVTYSKEEKLTIQVLERLNERLKKEKDQTLIFFGIPYLEQGRLCLYPVEVFGRERFYETQAELEEYLKEQGCPEEKAERKAAVPHRAQLPNGGLSLAVPGLNREIIKGMESFLGEIRQALGDLFQCGLNSTQEETLENLSRLAKESGTFGLHGAEEALAFLAETLGKKRHQMEFDPEPVLKAWIHLLSYVKLCQEKTSLDRALLEMEKADNGKEKRQ
ncbi:hypothetical protein IMSAGC007_01950 [Lachnospiraceae bacterium]|nr:hypothetical protein IMSAGC007_01950 [Lachnospiraceae bacterium]